MSCLLVIAAYINGSGGGGGGHDEMWSGLLKVVSVERIRNTKFGRTRLS